MRERLQERLCCAAVAEHDRPLRLQPVEDAASVDVPSIRPSRKTSVFTDGASEPTSSATASLCGAVTLAPAKPAAASPRTASSRRSGGTSSAT